MEIQREKFTFFVSYFEAAQALEEADRLVFYDAVCKYAFYGEDVDVPAHVRALFVMVKPYMDKSLAFSQKQSDNRKRPNKASEKEKSPKITKNHETFPERSEEEKENEKEREKINKKVNKVSDKKRFCPPTLEEVKMYCEERQNDVDAERFFDYYSANGWVQGKGTPIKDWKACIRTWEKNTIKTNQTVEKKENPFAQYGGVLI